ncbi:MAG TPA: hypothetical protein VNI60_07360, partial [Pyrinomonadaceae bacterium]|nr:hypothetical protein [Pyrinomonadaceae bacterium]
MATTIKPLHDRGIVRRIEESSDKTAGGLFIPDTAKEKPQEGEVIAVGRRNNPPDPVFFNNAGDFGIFLGQSQDR